MSEGGEGRTEIVCFEVVQVMNIHGHSVVAMVGTEIRKAREPSERLWRGTVSSLAEEERMVRGGL